MVGHLYNISLYLLYKLLHNIMAIHGQTFNFLF